MPGSNITISKKEYNQLVQKSKAGWAKYYQCFEQLMDTEHELSIKLSLAIQQNLDRNELVDNINSLLTVLKERTICAICLVEDLDKGNCVLLKCTHRYHKECHSEYRRSVRYQKDCPQCNK